MAVASIRCPVDIRNGICDQNDRNNYRHGHEQGDRVYEKRPKVEKSSFQREPFPGYFGKVGNTAFDKS